MAYKLKIGPAQGLKLKGQAGFALPMVGRTGIKATKEGGIWYVDLDYTVLTPGPVSDAATAYVAIEDKTAGIYREVSLASLLTSGLDADLQAIAALTSTGVLVRTADNTWSLRTVTGTANEITVTNGDGVSGNPTVSLPAALTFTGKTVTDGTFQSPAITTPTGIVKGDVGLGNVDNTSDLNKPVSTATQTALNAKVAGPVSAVAARIAIFSDTTGKVLSDGGHVLPTGTVVGTTDSQTLTNKTLTSPAITTPTGIVKGDVGLGNVDNTSDATKWAATATLTNKTFDTAGAGNSLSIAGVAANANTGTGAVVRAVSPALTGAPTAPTASPSDNSTKIATTAYVDAQVAGGVAGVASLNGQTGALTSYYPPQGRLTLQTGTPVMTTTQSAKTTIYYTPYIGNMIPIYDGTNMVPTAFSEISIATTDTTKNPAAIGASKVNDWFVWNDGGTLRLSHGPDWTNDTTRSAGTALVMVNGIYLNNASITNGPAASRGTYVGTTRSNASSQLDWIIGTATTAPFFNVWNTYNRVPVGCVWVEGTSGAYSLTTVRAFRGSAIARASFVRGLDEDAVQAVAQTYIDTNSGSVAAFGWGLDTTTTTVTSMQATAPSVAGIGSVQYVGLPGVGYHYLQQTEARGGTGTYTAYGTAGLSSITFNGRM